MASFSVYLIGCGDEGFDFTDSRWETAEALRDWLGANANRPCWIRLGRIAVFSQNIVAIEMEAE